MRYVYPESCTQNKTYSHKNSKTPVNLTISQLKRGQKLISIVQVLVHGALLDRGRGARILEPQLVPVRDRQLLACSDSCKNTF